MRRMAKASVTNATMVMRLPQREHTLAMSLARLAEHRLGGGSAARRFVSGSGG